MNAKTLTAALVLVAAAACSDKAAKQAAVDSTLAKDLALAGSQTAQQPTFQDTSIAPSPAPAARRQEQPAPVKARVAEKPVTHTPRPASPPPVVQQPAPTQVAQAQAPAPAPAPAPAHAEIGAGTGFALTSGSKVCSSSLPGDKFVATINGPVTGTNGAVIPAGSTVVLEVASATNGDNPQINFRVRAIVVGDKTYNVSADVQPEASFVKTKVENADPNADKKKVIGGAIAGALIGQIIGHNTKGTVIGAATGAAAGAAASKMSEKYEACLPAGSPMRVTLNSPLVVS
jgi:hypothetical protein